MNDILEMMEKYGLELTKQGSLYVTYCPFHRDENRPNFTIYPETNSYFCYTCSKGGNAIDFFSRMEKISYKEAEQRLYSNLQSLRDKINKNHEESPYNNPIAIQLAKQFRVFLYEQPEALADVMTLMQETDTALLKELDQDKAVDLVRDITSRLNSLQSVYKLISNTGEGSNEKNNIDL